MSRREQGVVLALAAFAGAVLATCGEDAPPSPPREPVPVVDVPAPPPLPAPPPPPPAPLAALGTELEIDEILEHLASDPPRSLRPVGTTNVVFHAPLDGPLDAAIKVRSRVARGGPEAEVAAYRIARLLGLDQVPPAALRRVPRPVLRARLDPAFISSWAEIESWTIWNEDDTTTCAAILWVPDLRASPLDYPGGTRAMDRVLADHDGRIDARVIHSDYAVMLAFDYLVGNTERWNGRNIAERVSGGRLILRDHDAAFTPILSVEPHRRLARDLGRARRLPWRFVERLIAASPARIRDELTRGGDGASLLEERAIAGVLDRRTALLAHAATLASEVGEDRAFSLP